MKNFLQYLGVIVLLLGVICLIVYKLALPENGLLIAAMALQLIGIVAFILINKRIG